jgi:hypothetical protein
VDRGHEPAARGEHRSAEVEEVEQVRLGGAGMELLGDDPPGAGVRGRERAADERDVDVAGSGLFGAPVVISRIERSGNSGATRSIAFDSVAA